MDAFVLAAGAGSRLRPYTDHVPKPMLPLSGRPMLEYTIRRLAAYGIQDLIVNLHYLPDVIRAHFGDGGTFGIRITYSEEPVLLGTAGAVKRWQPRLQTPLLVVYGDNLSRCDYTAMIAQHERTGAIATVAIHHRDDPTHSGMAIVDKDGRIRDFIEKPRSDRATSTLVNAGILVLEPRVLDLVPDDTPWDFSRDVLPRLLAAGERIDGFVIDGELIYIDRVADYERVIARIASGDLSLADY